MPSTPEPPFHRFGIRFTSDPTHDLGYLQIQHDDDEENAYRGELFLNEPLDEIYYVDATGVARRFGDRAMVPFSRVDFTGLREFADDSAASSASPPIEVGGLYRTGSTIKIRVV